MAKKSLQLLTVEEHVEHLAKKMVLFQKERNAKKKKHFDKLAVNNCESAHTALSRESDLVGM